MAAKSFRQRLKQQPSLVLLDGATGSELHRRGHDSRLPLWSARALINDPEAVARLHAEYAKAGAEIVTANTFRTTRRSIARAGLKPQAKGLTKLAVELAKKSKARFVAGSIAPLEDCYSPQLSPPVGECEREHGEHAENLAEAGVDLLLVETMNSIVEAHAAARMAAKTGLPVIVSFVCGSDGRLLSGERVKLAAERLLDLEPAALAINCTPTTVLHVPLAELVATVAGRVPVGAYGNIGKTDAVHGWMSTEELGPEGYAARAEQWIELGARIVGGCCGTTPAHVAALRKALDRREEGSAKK
jgi:S-methylmethionine-dependent homocysteine/selenocysteine methylase